MVIRVVLAAALSLSLAAAAEQAGPALPTPEEFLGFPVGTDRKLADYNQVVEYLRTLDTASDRLQLQELGKTTLGNTMVMAVISAPRNLEQALLYKDMARRLSDPRGMDTAEAERIIREGQVIVLITCNIHSTEIAASQMAMELAHLLATTEDPHLLRNMQNVILLLVPSLNPDGQLMEVDWYRKNLGTRFEGGRMPWLYHHYAGHDNNRDFFMLSLAETRQINRVLYHEWFPQIYLDEHQMGATGPRLFVPPFADPLARNIPPLIWRAAALVGANMALRAEQAGQAGVIDSYAYDGYWPGGSMNTAWWKNVVGLLTEMASARMATPIYVDESELAGERKGLPEYKAQINFPNPWRGGWWRLRDIVDYEMTASLSLLETASRHREDFLRGMHTLASDAIRRGGEEAPYAWAIPPDQHDPLAAATMVDLFREHGVEAHQASGELALAGRSWPAGTVFFLMDQPYRGFVQEMMERQKFPEIRPADGAPVYRPYDVTGWTLPLQMGVRAEPVEQPVPSEARASMVRLTARPAAPPGWGEVRQADRPDAAWLAIPHSTNEASAAINRLLKAGNRVYLAGSPFDSGGRRHDPGTILVAADKASLEVAQQAARDLSVGAEALGPLEGTGASIPVLELRAPRVALYKPWAASMDEGWTRLVLERAEFPFESLSNADIASHKGPGLREKFDVIVLPDVDRDVIVDGKPKPSDPTSRYFVPLPDEYAGGIGAEGARSLQSFVAEGGTLIALDSSAMLPISDFNVPARNVLESVKGDQFSCPGSLLKIDVDTLHPVGYGMPPRAAAYFADGPAFATVIPGGGQERRVIARYPDEPLLESGWIRGEELLRRRAAAVDLSLGKGRVILLGLRVQHRSQTHGTFKLLFNAIHYGASSPATLPAREGRVNPGDPAAAPAASGSGRRAPSPPSSGD